MNTNQLMAKAILAIEANDMTLLEYVAEQLQDLEAESDES